ncbi:MAG: methyl-accepting chemotaxis protein [Methanoregula sp.]|jgi:methyl-accepting chemotaxis protein|uniref:methyl-accepting chemotaxis protein n=1 Tax=Methanoregula sp. TaxID=2052170 RepID=UPI0025F77E44|nr:methyl-accepting chemotaxis protein [Methanoregula sp.]MCK9630860.1 methyl-accepting chemotaxis protein [Methanoregula sp.]
MIETKEFEQMFDYTPHAQAIVDRDLKFIKINPALTKLFGYPKDRLLGMKVTDLASKGLITYHRNTGKSFADAVELKESVFGEATIESPSGIHVIERATIPLPDGNGDINHIYLIYHEINALVKNREYLGHEIDEFIKVYDRMAAGDLTASHAVEKPTDPDLEGTFATLAKLRASVRNIISALQVNIKDVNRQMADLTSITDNAARSVDDASKSVNHIAKNAGMVSENAQKASEGVEQMTKAMQDMSAAVEEITSSMESVSSQAQTAKESAKSGAVMADEVNKNMAEITDSSNNVYGIVKDIEKQMNDIGKIIVLIRDLASQTNLLALNAAIEAARAGEHGRGFAVVASEVKSLAQESRSSAERIEEMITQLNHATKKATDAMEGSKVLVNKGLQESQAALEAFRQIQKAAETVANSASEVAAATEEQAATTEEITASVHEVAGLIGQTAKEAGDAAAASEESAAAIDEIARIVKAVNESAVQAMEANKRFKVD